MLPVHGKISCRECFKDTASRVCRPHPEWKMINDPGAWGGSEPDYLVLGFSKGATQAGLYDKGKFEDIAFAGMRPRLTQALQLMGVLGPDETVNQKIADPNGNIAFGSLIRCSVSRIDKKASEKKGERVYSCTGPLITRSFSEIPQVISKCAQRHLLNLPASVKTVFLLGNGDAYVNECQQLLKSLFPFNCKRINPMAVEAGGKCWIHLAHPSGLNGHFKTWATQYHGSGIKRIQAQEAMKRG